MIPDFTLLSNLEALVGFSVPQAVLRCQCFFSAFMFVFVGITGICVLVEWSKMFVWRHIIVMPSTWNIKDRY